VTPRTTLIYRYVFRKVLVSNINETINPLAIPLFSAANSGFAVWRYVGAGQTR